MNTLEVTLAFNNTNRWVLGSHHASVREIYKSRTMVYRHVSSKDVGQCYDDTCQLSKTCIYACSEIETTKVYNVSSHYCPPPICITTLPNLLATTICMQFWCVVFFSRLFGLYCVDLVQCNWSEITLIYWMIVQMYPH